MSSSPDHVYLDLSTVNNDTTGSLRRPLNFTETRTMDIIDNPSNYYMSVIRFEVDTPASSLPIFMPKLLLNATNTDIDTTAYSITMARPNLDTGLLEDVVQRYVEWSPQEKTANLPNNLYINTGVPNQDVVPVQFIVQYSDNGNSLPATNPVILPATVVATDLNITKAYQYVGSPIFDMLSQIQFVPANSSMTLTNPAPINIGGLRPFQITIGTFKTSVPALKVSTSGIALFGTFRKASTDYSFNATLVSITEVLVPSGDGYVYIYILNGNSDSDDLNGVVSFFYIDVGNSSSTQFLGKVPQITGTQFLTQQVITPGVDAVNQINTTFDDNYFNLPDIQSTNQSLATIGARMTLSRAYYSNLPENTYNYTTTNWTGLPATPIPLTTLTNYKYSQDPGSTVSYTMTLAGGEQSPIVLVYNGGFSCDLIILVSNPIPTSDTLQFLRGSTFNVAINEAPEIVYSRTILSVSLPEIIAIGSSQAYKIPLFINSPLPLPPSGIFRQVTTCSFTNVDLNVISDSRTLLATPPPTQSASITSFATLVYLNDTIATNLTLLGRMKSLYQTGGNNLSVFSLSYSTIFTPPAVFPTTINYRIISFYVAPITPTLSTQDYATGYYNCYNVKWWLNCVNKTLALLWADIGGLDNYAPQMVVDSNTNLITLMTPFNTTAGADPSNFAVSDNVASTASYLGTGSSPAVNYSMFFNEPMYNLFSAFTSIHYGTTSITNAQLDTASQATVAGNFSIFAYYIQAINYNFKNYLTTNNSLINETQNWFLTESEYSPVPMWNPISSLIFSTSFIPVQMSLTTNPNVYGSSTYDATYANGTDGNNSQISTMISDIQVPLTTGSEYKPTVLYSPANEYRLIDLNGNVPLKQASFSISYKTKFGEVLPFYLGSLCGANLKIMFRRKRFNLGNVAPYDTN